MQPNYHLRPELSSRVLLSLFPNSPRSPSFRKLFSDLLCHSLYLLHCLPLLNLHRRTTLFLDPPILELPTHFDLDEFPLY